MHKNITSITVIIVAALTSPNAALDVIGSGYGRTGTDSLREALNELGYKTYHMNEIIEGRLLSDVDVWTALAENDCDDVDALKDLFDRGGWTAAVDFPASICWESLIRIYPNAKVVHTERDSEEKWWDSVSNSIAILPKTFPINVIMRLFPFWRSYCKMLTALWSSIAGGNMTFSDPGWPSAYKSELVASYSANNQRVRLVVPRERLLIQDHSKGWNLLAKFLGKDIPNKRYPHKNARTEIIGTARRLSVGFSVAAVVFIAITAFVIKKLAQFVVKRNKNKKD